MRAQPLILALTALAAPVLAGCSDDPQEFEPTATPPISALSEPVPWDNATVYFVITDRFYDGDPSNNSSYGRALDGGDEVGTFHGGDLAGLTAKLEEGYFSRLGVSALWITAPYEQIHGWVPGGSGDFKHYPYHGYYARDFTRIDANMGTPDDFTTFVAAAHSRGIRVVLDVVMNHPGYAAIQDLAELPEHHTSSRRMGDLERLERRQRVHRQSCAARIVEVRHLGDAVGAALLEHALQERVALAGR